MITDFLEAAHNQHLFRISGEIGKNQLLKQKSKTVVSTIYIHNAQRVS